MSRCCRRAGAALLLMVPAPAAWSHIGFAANDLYAGMLHPLLHFSTLLPLLALSTWLSQVSVRAMRVLAPAFGIAVLAGAAVPLLQHPVPELAAVFLPLAVLLGLLLVLDQQPPLRTSLLLVVTVGFFEGYDNVAQVRADLTDPMLYVVGLMLTLGLVLLHVVGLLHNREQLWVRTGARVLGSWIASAGLLVLVLRWSGYAMAGVSP